MSWQDILDISLLQSGKITKAAIVGQDGDLWAESADYNMTSAERGALANGFGTYATGHPAREIVVGGRTYATTMGCLDVLLARCQDDDGGGGCVVKKTALGVIVAEYVPTANEMVALALVERLADYLVSRGY